MLTAQVFELDPTDPQALCFVRNGAPRRIARNDHIALWREEQKRLPYFRYTIKDRRPLLNARKYQAHPLVQGSFPERG